MYVCICNRIKRVELERVAAASAGCARTAYALLGSAPRCGTCLDFAVEIIAGYLDGAEPPAAPAWEPPRAGLR